MKVKRWFDQNGSFKEGMTLLDELGIKDKELNKVRFYPNIPFAYKKRLKTLLAPYIEQIAQVSKEELAIQELRDKGRLMLKKQDQLRAQLKVVDTEEQRFEIARQIMEEVIPTINEIYDQIRTYEETGMLPNAQEKTIVQLTVKKMLRLQSLRPRISRLKKMLEKKLEDKARQSYEKELLEKELEVQQIIEELELD